MGTYFAQMRGKKGEKRKPDARGGERDGEC